VVSYTYPTVGTFTAVVTAGNSVSEMPATTVVTITGPTYFIYLPLAMKTE
jgi:hypothetical protein